MRNEYTSTEAYFFCKDLIVLQVYCSTCYSKMQEIEKIRIVNIVGNIGEYCFFLKKYRVALLRLRGFLHALCLVEMTVRGGCFAKDSTASH